MYLDYLSELLFFGAIAYAVASSKAKDKDSKYGPLCPVSSQGFSTGIYV